MLVPEGRRKLAGGVARHERNHRSARFSSCALKAARESVASDSSATFGARSVFLSFRWLRSFLAASPANFFRPSGTIACCCKLLVVGALLTTPAFAVDAPSAAEAKLRESLRATTLQLRTAETERAALQAEKVEFEEKIKTLTEKIETEVKNGEAQKKASEDAITTLHQRLDNQSGEIKRLQESLEKWKTSQKQAATLAEATEAKRARSAAEVVVLNRKVADQRTKNIAMYQLGLEILERYKKFGLGAALTAREPFVGLTRVKFENLIQDYGEKLDAEKIKP
jgi:hypothetical protein